MNVKHFLTKFVIRINMTTQMLQMIKNIFYFYLDGFREMTIGKKLWTIIFIKLFIMFVLLRLFFFNDFLNSKFKNNQEKSKYVIEQLTK